MTATCDFVSLEEEMRELLLKKWKRKKKEKERRKEKKKIVDHMFGQRRREIFALCCSVSWRS